MNVQETASYAVAALAAFSDSLPDGYTVERSEAEAAKERELQERPGFAKLKACPRVMAMRALKAKTGLRFSYCAGADGLALTALAYRMTRKGLPTGGAKVGVLAEGLTASQALALVQALAA